MPRTNAATHPSPTSQTATSRAGRVSSGPTTARPAVTAASRRAGYWFTDGHSRSVTLGQSPPTARPIVNPISQRDEQVTAQLPSAGHQYRQQDEQSVAQGRCVQDPP